MVSKRQCRSVVRWFVVIAFQVLVLLDYCSVIDAARKSTPLTLQITKTDVVMDNGLIKVNLTNPTGSISGIKYQGIHNLMQTNLGATHRGYWDIDWKMPHQRNSISHKILATNFTVITQHKHKIEVSFTNTLDDHTGIPIHFDKRYVMRGGQSGFYTYAIYDHPQGAPDVDIHQTRLAVKLNQSWFQYMAITDDIQGEMPRYDDRLSGMKLKYKEAVLLTTPSNPKFKGQVDDKYQYTLESKDMNVYGWISSKAHVGFWLITGSNEVRFGGPVKQDLTCHCGPIALSMFLSLHYAGDNCGVKLRNGEAWRKVFGPVFLYLNTDPGYNPRTLWEDAKKQMWVETKSWPYSFLTSKDYPARYERGTVDGRLLLHNGGMNNTNTTPAKSAHIGLAAPGNPGSWQFDLKDYQFWTQTDINGNFKITAIRPGRYSLYAWIPGYLGEFKHKVDLDIKPGDNINVGDLVHDPPRNGATLWEIGIPDRKAAEFFIPDPAPDQKNYLLNNHLEKFRGYGLWDRYTDLYPENDLVFKVGESDPAKDWFFAHVNRKHPNGHYVATTWTILFPLEDVNVAGSYTLRIALASSTSATIAIWINSDPLKRNHPKFTLQDYGRDNAIARHGIHGLYSEHSLSIPGSELVKGENSIKLRQTKAGSPFHGVMYDYIRLEGPHT